MTRSEPNKRDTGLSRLLSLLAATAVLLCAGAARATIDGISGTSFELTAKPGYISVADGGSIYSWGYTTGAVMQLPGPTLIVDEGAAVTVKLNNALPVAAGNTSIVFPGQQLTGASGGVPGLLAQEAEPGGSVTYTFTATTPGTYQYYSATRSDLQVEMGLYGAIIVRPSSPSTVCATIGSGMAYDHPGACFDREYLFLLSEVDIEVHKAAELQSGGPGPIEVGSPPFHPEYWLINGRVGPDTLAAPGTALLPTQPYNALPRMHPGERLLLRVVGAGRDMHPFHTHGNHARVLARDGRLLLSESDPTQLAGPLLFTIPSVPGETVDAIFEWTGKDLGWDIYGSDPLAYQHSCNSLPLLPSVGGNAQPNPSAGYDSVTKEYCPDHGKPIPVTLPDLSVLAFGGFWSGSPYLGVLGSLPPGEGGLNPSAGFTYMWHSHTERELVNNDVFPGGMMTMLIIEPPSEPIE